ncbi:MAG: VOC family protein [Pseudolysinimonas sp.]
MTILNPYISFDDNAREAIEFYKSVFGGEVVISTFAEMPGSDPAEVDKVMHSQLTTPNGLVIMAADTPASMSRTVGDNIGISLSGEDEAELSGYWNKLTAGGTVTVPFEKAPWGDVFGMCVDKFGINWMVNATAPAA